MKLMAINLFLLILCFFLVLNIFFPFNNLTGTFIKDKLGCEINGNFVNDADLCCYEMQKFSSCKDGICISKNYQILANNDILRYCKRSDYDVKF